MKSASNTNFVDRNLDLKIAQNNANFFINMHYTLNWMDVTQYTSCGKQSGVTFQERLLTRAFVFYPKNNYCACYVTLFKKDQYQFRHWR